MATIRLTLDRDEQRELDYILNRLKPVSDLTVVQTEHKNFITLDLISSTKGYNMLIEDIIISVILTFYKYKIIAGGVFISDNYNLVKYALLGAILSFDEDQERSIILKDLDKHSNYSIKSIYEFRLSKLRDSWHHIVSLANRLLTQCSSENDIYDLIFFLLAVDADLAPAIKLEKDSEQTVILSDGVRLPILNLTDDDNANILISIVKERPGSIVINQPLLFDKELVQAIQKLGEGS